MEQTNTKSTVIHARMVRTATVCFISDYFERDGYSYYYHHTELADLLFDGKQPVPSYKKTWLVIDKFPATIQRKVPGALINRRWEIKDEDMASAKLPKVIAYDDVNFCDSDGDFMYDNLYFQKFDTSPETIEDVEIEWDIILDVPDFVEPPEIKFDGIHKLGYKDCPYTVDSSHVSHQALDEMLFPEILLHARPAEFSSKTVYDITRQYVIDHIDVSVAKITSNYDFCFEVKKIIPLHVPEKITYHNIFARTKREREKLRTSIKEYKEYSLFEMTHEESKYKGYTPIPKMVAESEHALKAKMQQWLDCLMEEINRPLAECPHCKGIGFTVGGKVTANYTEE